MKTKTKATETEVKSPVKVKVLRGFALPLQGSFKADDKVMLHFGKIQGVGVLTREHYKKLLKLGYFKPIEEEVTDGKV